MSSCEFLGIITMHVISEGMVDIEFALSVHSDMTESCIGATYDSGPNAGIIWHEGHTNHYLSS